MPIIATPDLSIRYREAGTGEQALVFLHGNYASSRWWVPQLERVPDCIHAFAPDLRGCGGREGRTEPQARLSRLSIRDLANDLDLFIHALGIQAPILVGHSLGGVIATQYAVEHPQEIRALVLVDTAPPGGLPMAAFAGPYTLPLALGSRTIMRVALRHAGLPRVGALPEALIDDALCTEPDQYTAFTQSLVRWNVEAELPSLEVLTLVMWGQKDRVISSRVARQYMQLLPNAQLAILPQTGHSPPIERPDRFAVILKTFVATLTPEATSSNSPFPAHRLAMRARLATRFKRLARRADQDH